MHPACPGGLIASPEIILKLRQWLGNRKGYGVPAAALLGGFFKLGQHREARRTDRVRQTLVFGAHLLEPHIRLNVRGGSEADIQRRRLQ